MSGQNALIARMGIDLNGLKGDLTAAEKLAVRAANNMASELNRAAKGKGGHGAGPGGGHGAGNARVFGDPINALTGSTGNVAKVGMLSHLTGAAGPAAAILLVAQTIAGIASALVELDGQTNAIRKIRGKGSQAWTDKFLPHNLQQGVQLGDAQMSSVEGMREQSEKLREEAGKPLKGGFYASLGAMIAPAVVDPIVDRHEEEKRGAMDDRIKMSQKIAEATRAEAAAKETAAHVSGRQGELDLAAVEHKKRLAEITDKYNKGLHGETGGILGDEAKAQTQAAEEEYERVKETINLKRDAAFQQLDMQNRANAFRAKDDDEGVKSAQDRVEFAQKAVDAGAGLAQEERDRREANLKTAQTDLELVTRRRDVIRAEQATQIAIADSQEDADHKHLSALERGRKDLEAERKTATEDRKKDIDVELAKNDEATRAAKNKLMVDAFGESNARIDAGQGDGQAEARRAALAHIGEEEALLQEMKKNKEAFSDRDRAEQQAKIQGMKRAYDDVAHSIAMGNAAAKAQTGEMALQYDHQATIAEAVRVQFEYEQKIAEAQYNQNGALEEQLKKQKEIALQQSLRKAAEAKQEQNGLTLSDLAKRGGHFGHEARQIERLEKRADRMRGVGRNAESDALHNRAEGIKRGLEHRGIIKPSQANLDLAKSMDSSQVLKEIRDHTAKLGVNL